MSVITDALRKAERASGEANSVDSGDARYEDSLPLLEPLRRSRSGRTRKRSIRALFLVGILLIVPIALIVVTYNLLRSSPPSPPTETPLFEPLEYADPAPSSLQNPVPAEHRDPEHPSLLSQEQRPPDQLSSIAAGMRRPSLSESDTRVDALKAALERRFREKDTIAEGALERTPFEDVYLSGIMHSGARPVAVINNMLFHEGEEFDSIRVIKIHPHSVEVERQGFRTTLHLR